MPTPERILVIDDEPGMGRFLTEALSDEGYTVETFQEGGPALKRVQESPFDLVISDIRMPQINGIDLLKALRQTQNVPVILMTAFGSVESAVEAMKEGASDYLTKPFKTAQIKLVVRRLLERARLERENQALRAALAEQYAFKNIVGATPAMRKIFELMHRVKDLPSTVLITGESGTGKELVARTLHFNSVRKEKAFVAIDCSALPEALLESELFGHQAGTFGAAGSAKAGLLESADGGTVFLDEIGDMAIDLQAKLLRFLQEGEIRRVGSTQSQKVDVRVIAATHRDLARMVKEGTFRRDLYFRLAVVPVHLPALRERKEDIPALIDFLMKGLSKKLGRSLVQCEGAAVETLLNREWPGNVRELQNALEFAAAISVSPILKREHFITISEEDRDPILSKLAYREAKRLVLDRFERKYLEALLQRAGGNISQAARLADMDRKNFSDLLKRYEPTLDAGTQAKPPHP